MRGQIRSEVLKLLSGYCFEERHPDTPRILILSPWIRDVKLEIEGSIPEPTREWFYLNYGIASINLPYALLLLKLDYGAHIDIITLPPTEKHHGRQASSTRNLLDFFDEIGCNVYTNPDLHSKLFLSNDLALLGSFNLSFPALWGKEEIGVSVDDMENLKNLENYAREVINSSKQYGYTLRARSQAHRQLIELHKAFMENARTQTPFRLPEIRFPKITSITRGWLFEQIINASISWVDPASGFTYACHEFLSYHFKTVKSFQVVDLAATNIDAFYTSVLLAFLKTKSKEERLHFLSIFDYRGTAETENIVDFTASIFARSKVPQISPNILKMPKLE